MVGAIFSPPALLRPVMAYHSQDGKTTVLHIWFISLTYGFSWADA